MPRQASRPPAIRTSLAWGFASLIIASTAASMSMEVEIFFTFWGINVLKEKRIIENKDLLEKMIDIMTPAGPEGMPVSQMNMLGAGAALLKRMMKEKDVISANELLDVARESGVKLNVCSMTMEVMGIRKEELITDIEEVGAASYITKPFKSSTVIETIQKCLQSPGNSF